VGDAVAVGDDQRGAVVALRFLERLDRLHVLGPEGDPGHVDVAVGHGHHADVLLARLLARGSELGRGPDGGGLGRLECGAGTCVHGNGAFSCAA